MVEIDSKELAAIPHGSDCNGVFGGAEVDLYLLGTELAKDQNFHVTFITADWGQPEEEIREQIKKEEKDKDHIERLENICPTAPNENGLRMQTIFIY